MNIAQLAFHAIWSPNAGPPPSELGSKLPSAARIEEAVPRPDAQGEEKPDVWIQSEDGLPAYGPRVVLTVPPATSAIAAAHVPPPLTNADPAGGGSRDGLGLGRPDVPQPASNGGAPTPTPQLTSEGLGLGRPDVPQPASNGGAPTPTPQPTSQGLGLGRPDVPQPTSNGSAPTPTPQPTSQGLGLGRPDVPQPASNGGAPTPTPQPTSQGLGLGRPD
ncbi:MAG: hypothetical protein IT207_01595, partial [Fimbriimonadaceae bacterium]|nr:hypothetical protein [Fimbriimonadaceae bacterium]